jgi:hypothetical protein
MHDMPYIARFHSCRIDRDSACRPDTAQPCKSNAFNDRTKARVFDHRHVKPLSRSDPSGHHVSVQGRCSPGQNAVRALPDITPRNQASMEGNGIRAMHPQARNECEREREENDRASLAAECARDFPTE